MAEKPPEKVEAAPDPDEDDLDDLDDVLDQFQSGSTANPPAASQQPSTSTTAPSASGPGRPAADQKNAEGVDAADEDLRKHLEAGMAQLMSELDSQPDMQKQFEQMMQELVTTGAAPSDQEAAQHLKHAAASVPPASPSEDKAAKPGPSGKKDDFSHTIRKTMERMQQSGDAATAATAGVNQSEDDLLAQMLQELQAGGEGGEEDFNKMLMGMMSQLTNKEILYEPMKELHDKFPAWMEKNEGKVPKDELNRYREQQTLVAEIVARFERKRYSDDNEDDREYIVERMQKMQAAGSPPPDLVGDMNAAQEALSELDSGCPQQ